MDFNSTVDLIIKDLNETREIIDDFKNYPGVPLLQVELAKSKCKSAAEVISLLKNLQSFSQPAERKESIFNKPERKTEPAKKLYEESEFSPRPPMPAADNTNVSSHGKNPEPVILADTFSNQPGSINEQLGSLRDDGGILDIIQNKPVTNLLEAIGVNDKFLFIREIFNGNPEAYNQAIVRLNEIGTLADAEAIIMSFTGNNIETEATRLLLDIVKRKFPANE